MNDQARRPQVRARGAEEAGSANRDCEAVPSAEADRANLRQQRGGTESAITYATIDSPLGPLMIAATERGLSFAQFGEGVQALLSALRSQYPWSSLELISPDRAPPPFSDWIAALADYLHGRLAALDLPTDVRATAFQRTVWDALRRIPYGQVRSYGAIAHDLGRPKAVRAVGGAIAANRVALVIPCHRVIQSDGALGGFRWGVERKRFLIARERESSGLPSEPPRRPTCREAGSERRHHQRATQRPGEAVDGDDRSAGP